jgi:hypothetical protein
MRAALAARDEDPMVRKLFADLKFLDDLAISINILLCEIVKEASALADQFQEAEATMVILLVTLKVRRQHVDVGCKDGNLHFRAARICATLPVLLDDLRLLFFANRHCDSLM